MDPDEETVPVIFFSYFWLFKIYTPYSAVRVDSDIVFNNDALTTHYDVHQQLKHEV